MYDERGDQNHFRDQGQILIQSNEIIEALEYGIRVVPGDRDRGDLVPDDVMGNLSFTAACLTVLMMSAIFFAALLYLPQFMSKVLKSSSLRKSTISCRVTVFS